MLIILTDMEDMKIAIRADYVIRVMEYKDRTRLVWQHVEGDGWQLENVQEPIETVVRLINEALNVSSH